MQAVGDDKLDKVGEYLVSALENSSVWLYFSNCDPTFPLPSQPNYPPVSHFLKRELLQIMPVVGGYIAFQAREM